MARFPLPDQCDGFAGIATLSLHGADRVAGSHPAAGLGDIMTPMREVEAVGHLPGVRGVHDGAGPRGAGGRRPGRQLALAGAQVGVEEPVDRSRRRTAPSSPSDAG